MLLVKHITSSRHIPIGTGTHTPSQTHLTCTSFRSIISQTHDWCSQILFHRLITGAQHPSPPVPITHHMQITGTRITLYHIHWRPPHRPVHISTPSHISGAHFHSVVTPLVFTSLVPPIISHCTSTPLVHASAPMFVTGTPIMISQPRHWFSHHLTCDTSSAHISLWAHPWCHPSSHAYH